MLEKVLEPHRRPDYDCAVPILAALLDKNVDIRLSARTALERLKPAR